MNWDPSICRVCLESQLGKVDLCVKVELKDDCTYIDIFNSCTGLSAQIDDDLPKNICNRCSSDLLTCFEFLNKAIASDQFLKNSLTDEKELQYFTDYDENKDIDEEVELKDPPFVEVNTSTYYEENAETLDESNNHVESIIGNTFEIVHCGLHSYEDDDGLSKQCDKKFENPMETELAIEFVSNEYSTYTPTKSERVAPGNKSVECNICGKLLKQWSMKHHYKRCHKNEKLHLCSACPKTFTIQSDLRIHMKTHDKARERNFLCTVCRKGFYEKQSLGVHMLRHTGVKHYQCKICQKKFTTKKSLEVHEFTHNRQTGRFVCKHCSKRFPSNADLIVHERFHTGDYPYKCDLCDKSYAVKSHYNYHIAKHKGVTYKCEQCDKEFMNRGSLTSHRFKHRERMPHECSICKKGFASPFKLNRHQSCHKTTEDDLQLE